MKLGLFQNKGSRNAALTAFMCFLAVSATSAASISLLAIIQFKETRDTFFSRLGTDLSLASLYTGIIAEAYEEPKQRTEKLKEIASKYIGDERISCVNLMYERAKISFPPAEICKKLRRDEVVDLRFGASQKGVAQFHVSHERLDADNNRHLLYTVTSFAVIGLSIIIASIVLARLRVATKERIAIDTVDRIFEITPSLLIEVDNELRIKRSSKRLTEYILDHGSEDVDETKSLFDEESVARIEKMINRSRVGNVPGSSLESLVSLRLFDDSRPQFNANVQPNPLTSGESFFVFLSDISALANEKTRLARLLRTDYLTGALSRRYLEEIYSDGVRSRDVGILMIDIDFFKSINDNYGHETGDLFLKHITVILQHTLPSGSEIIRLSGEEFLAITEATDPDTLLAYGNGIKQKMASTALHINNMDLIRTVSIGAADLKSQGKLVDSLRIADHALSVSKQNGRNRVTYIAEWQFNQYMRRKPTMEEVENAVREDQIDLHYEPVYEYHSGCIVGFESLLRWHNKIEWIQPVDFLEPYYNVTNRMSGGRSRFELFAGSAAHFSKLNGTAPWLSYNIWPGDIDGALLEHLDILEPWLRSRCVLEVSEKLLFTRQHETKASSVLHEASEKGYRIALDDFGVEGSNLSRLQSYPVDIVKIDKSLTANLDQAKQNLLIIESIANLASKLGIVVVAEGVEGSTDADLLAEVGVVLHQGHWYGKSMPADEAVDLVSMPSGSGRCA